MDVTATTTAPIDTEADTVAVCVQAGKGIAHDLPGGELQALVDAGEARAEPSHVAVTHAGGRRWVLVGIGDRDALDGEVLRRAGAAVHDRARQLGARSLCFELPHRLSDAGVAPVVEGVLLAAHRVDELRTRPADEGDAPGLRQLVLSDHADRGAAVARAATVARAQNRARRLQDLPANVCTPAFLAERARELAARHEHLEVDVLGPEEIAARGMGLLQAVAKGSAVEPRVIVLRLRAPGARGPRIGLVGKGVTFDTGGLWLKPNASLMAMKVDMSGGAAVIESIGALAELGVPADVVGVVGATENSLDGASMRPGDVVRSMAGTTVQIDNTDAEGRLLLADCLHLARAQEGAERLVDLATLTGAAVTALGRHRGALFADGEAWAAAVADAAQAAGEPVWRLPLGPEWARELRGGMGDLKHFVEGRRGGAIIAAEFLHAFVGDVPWAHLDMTGAYDTGWPYSPKGGTGWGVRTLVELVSRSAGAASSAAPGAPAGSA